MDHERDRRVGDRAEQREILPDVVADLRVDARVDGDLGDGAHHHGLAVGRRGGGIARGDRAAGAGAVLHDHGLSQALGEPGGDDARQDVGATAGREGHLHAQRPVLRTRQRPRAEEQRGKKFHAAFRSAGMSRSSCPKPGTLSRQPIFFSACHTVMLFVVSTGLPTACSRDSTMLAVHQLPQARNTASASLRSALRPCSKAVSGWRRPTSLLLTTPIATWLSTSMPCASRKSATHLLVVSLQAAASATRRTPSVLKASSIAVAAVVAGLPLASSMRLMSCAS